MAGGPQAWPEQQTTRGRGWSRRPGRTVERGGTRNQQKGRTAAEGAAKRGKTQTKRQRARAEKVQQRQGKTHNATANREDWENRDMERKRVEVWSKRAFARQKSRVFKTSFGSEGESRSGAEAKP